MVEATDNDITAGCSHADTDIDRTKLVIIAMQQQPQRPQLVSPIPLSSFYPWPSPCQDLSALPASS